MIEEIRAGLLELAEPKLKEFHEKLIPSSHPILGIRAAKLKAFAKGLKDFPAAYSVLLDNPPASYEEIALRGLLIPKLKLPIEKLLDETARQISLMDNWAECDTFFSEMKIIAKHRDAFFDRFEPYTTADGEFEKRAIVVMAMDYFLAPDYQDKAEHIFTTVKCGEYYVDMAVAWALSVYLVKNYPAALSLIRTFGFSPTVLKMTAGKARDSFRLTPEQKQEVKAEYLKVK